MKHNCWLLALIVLAYVWHAVLEAADRYLEEWFKKHPGIREGVFAVGAMLLLAPAIYYGGELHEALQSALATMT